MTPTTAGEKATATSLILPAEFPAEPIPLHPICLLTRLIGFGGCSAHAPLFGGANSFVGGAGRLQPCRRRVKNNLAKVKTACRSQGPSWGTRLIGFGGFQPAIAKSGEIAQLNRSKPHSGEREKAGQEYCPSSVRHGPGSAQFSLRITE